MAFLTIFKLSTVILEKVKSAIHHFHMSHNTLGLLPQISIAIVFTFLGTYNRPERN